MVKFCGVLGMNCRQDNLGHVIVPWKPYRCLSKLIISVIYTNNLNWYMAWYLIDIFSLFFIENAKFNVSENHLRETEYF